MPSLSRRRVDNTKRHISLPTSTVMAEALKGDQESFHSGSHRLLGLFLLVSGLLHGMLLATNPQWFRKEPLQVIELELSPRAEPKAERVKHLEPAPSLPMPDVKPKPRTEPKPRVESKPQEKPRPRIEPKPREVIPKPLQRVKVPQKVKKPKPKPAAPKVASAVKETSVPAVDDTPSSASTTTTPVGSSHGQTASRASNTEDAVKLFLAQVRQRIDRYKHYPYAARRRQLEGRVTLRFVIRPDGTIDSLEVVKGSSSTLLDKAALKAVRDASPFPGFPREILGRPLAVQMALVFELT
ncbi:energy transducer TonB [Desulfosoma caldarium]|uniref:Outer membrane transport energization protein TonB n=1 Tax=Desulfosoma caldarium TaxID=610254 RepID=A0A3N1UUU0_9BACT|nr:energy transducer TonB [Desulfosoma caldarium]ROQ93189.1 outer membrane transport energization protein TonB [Desulfosoma caldarium]